jgi:DNA replication protein DnaC
VTVGAIFETVPKEIQALADVALRIGPMPPSELARRQAVADQQKQRERVQECWRLWERASVWPQYANADIEAELPADFPPDARAGYGQASAQLCKLLDAPGIVALCGPHGTGKTHMACGLIRAFCRRVKSALYCRAVDFFNDHKSTFGPMATSALRNVVERYQAPALLVIDEYDLRADSCWEAIQLNSVIDWRSGNLRSTLVLANRWGDDLERQLGERIVDRMRQDGGKVLCNWRTLRGRLNRPAGVLGPEGGPHETGPPTHSANDAEASGTLSLTPPKSRAG